jgi:hypothetical protein
VAAQESCSAGAVGLQLKIARRLDPIEAQQAVDGPALWIERDLVVLGLRIVLEERDHHFVFAGWDARTNLETAGVLFIFFQGAADAAFEQLDPLAVEPEIDHRRNRALGVAG